MLEQFTVLLISDILSCLDWVEFIPFIKDVFCHFLPPRLVVMYPLAVSALNVHFSTELRSFSANGSWAWACMILTHVWLLGSVWALCQVMPVGRRGGTRRRQREGEAERKNASREVVEWGGSWLPFNLPTNGNQCHYSSPLHFISSHSDCGCLRVTVARRSVKKNKKKNSCRANGMRCKEL